MISIVAPILTFVQMFLAEGGRWGGGLHPLNAFLILGMYGWLFHTLRRESTVAEPAAGRPLPAR